MPGLGTTDAQKVALRKQLHRLRREQPEKDRHSQAVFDRLFLLKQYIDATTILFYVHVRDEVRTLASLEVALASPKRIAVPYCQDGELHLVELRGIDELSPGAYGIHEPSADLRRHPDRVIPPMEIDFALIPGLGFTTQGERIGHGKGYYDKLLPNLKTSCLRCGIAYDCQIVEAIPVSEHDQSMDMVATQSQTIRYGEV